jgi:hypothetical protein
VFCFRLYCRWPVGPVHDRRIRGSQTRRLPHVLRDGEPGSFVGAMDDRYFEPTWRPSVREFGVAIGFGKWLIVAVVPALTALLLLPLIVAHIFPPGLGRTPEAPAAARKGGSQNVIFVSSGYLTQPELYRLGLLVTLFFLAVFLIIGTPWILLVTYGVGPDMNP